MENKYEINYKLIFTIMALVVSFAFFIVMLIWKENSSSNILMIILLVGAIIYGITQLFVPDRIKSVEVVSNAIIIEYRKTSVTVPFEEFKKLAHYKRGPLTERIWVYAGVYKYEIPFDLKNCHDMCRNIYLRVSEINNEQIADDWFQKEFGKQASL